MGASKINYSHHISKMIKCIKQCFDMVAKITKAGGAVGGGEKITKACDCLPF